MVGKRVANKSAAKPTLRDQADQLRRAGHFGRALEVYEAHLREQPDDYQALLDQGSVLMSLERFSDAAQVYSKMVQIKPNETVLSNLGAALIRLGRANEAKVVLDYALEINPKNINARINLGGVLQALGMHQENLQNALEAVSIDPTQPLAFNNLGSALFDLAKFPEAKHAFETAILLDSKNLDAQINIANIESKLGSPQASIEAYRKALSLLPPEAKQRAEAIRFYMSFEYLKQGMLPEGWDCYEGGFSNLVPVAGARHPRRNFSVPRWNGEALNGKTLLVWREQGLGDELLFATCLHELEALGGKIIVECDKRLVDTFTRSFPQYTVRAEALLPEQAMQSPYNDFDLHVPLGSLMKHFRRDIKDFERSGAYIKTDPAKVAKFSERLAPYKEDYRLVGICWRSGKLDPVRNLGYTALDEWGEVLQTPGFKFVNLQYGECEAELRQAEEKYGVEILRWPDLNLKDDLDDVFALMHSLDAVASVQTAVLVMGGSVGLPTVGVKAGGWTNLGHVKSPFFKESSYNRNISFLVDDIEHVNFYALNVHSITRMGVSEITPRDLSIRVHAPIAAMLRHPKRTNKALLDLKSALNISLFNPEDSEILMDVYESLLLGSENYASVPQYRDLSAVLARRLVEFGFTSEGISCFDKLQEYAPLPNNYQIDFISDLVSVGEFGVAKTYSDRWLMQNGLEDVEAKTILEFAKVYAENGLIDDAEFLVTRAYEVDQTLRDGRWNIIDALMGHERWPEAMSFFERDISESRGNTAFFHRKAKLVCMAGGLSEAMAYIRKSYLEDASIQDAFSALALQFLGAGNDSFVEYLIELEELEGRPKELTQIILSVSSRLQAGAHFEDPQPLIDQVNTFSSLSLRETAAISFGVVESLMGNLGNAKTFFGLLGNSGHGSLSNQLFDFDNTWKNKARKGIFHFYYRNRFGADLSSILFLLSRKFGCVPIVDLDTLDRKINRYRGGWMVRRLRASN
jgi:tetratricopeptide (TPR) repeat protein